MTEIGGRGNLFIYPGKFGGAGISYPGPLGIPGRF